ncbi:MULTISPECIES: hypothetical protein [Streptomyces]|uniref:Uncharacterized protein n=1 Tax=Streptomyces eurythermus TaxID=42237 RepID=A0ABW6Z741_9ACTN|nr:MULTISPECIES: hypothetical protein [Streptomyces]QIS75072.1 hypothetical protein HB370_38145 [Streptomyces sp. DSM 40868]
MDMTPAYEYTIDHIKLLDMWLFSEESLAALQATLDTATASTKPAGKRHPAPMARRLLLLRRGALDDRRTYAAELDYLRDAAATVTQVEYALNNAEMAAEALRAFDRETDGIYGSGFIWTEHPIWNDNPDLDRAYV